MKFLKSVVTEMKQVTWPTNKELSRLTWVVVASVVGAGVFFGLVDSALTLAMNAFLSLH